ncbi:MAG TPA: PAS domain-containing protein, partial [Phenylobacterium sp.]|nr:PAS domain-containing protein [Phenylobacterium sp.]
LAAASAALTSDPESPLEAAELALKTGAGVVEAVAVLDGSRELALAGAATGVDWPRLAAFAERSPQSAWLAAEGEVRAVLVAAASVSTPAGRRWLFAAVRPERLDSLLKPDAPQAIFTTRGLPLAISGPDGVSQAESLTAAFAVAPSELRSGRLMRAEAPEGRSLQIASHPAANDALLVVTGLAADPMELLAAREQLGWVLIPLAVAFLLGLLLFQQSRQAEATQQAFFDSEQRFRLAVEAARCGIWEWDLVTDEVFMSDVTAGMLGWGGGGVASGSDVLDRVSADHRDRVRQALATAAMYGAFDVSFRVPGEPGERPLWVDARGQAFGQARE